MGFIFFRLYFDIFLIIFSTIKEGKKKKKIWMEYWLFPTPFFHFDLP